MERVRAFANGEAYARSVITFTREQLFNMCVNKFTRCYQIDACYQGGLRTAGIVEPTAAYQHKSNKSSSRKKEIKKLQQTLKDAGYDIGPIDGIYGKKTRQAYEAYKQDKQASTNNSVEVFWFENTNSIITGHVKIEKHFGPPGYGETPKIDRIEYPFILILAKPILVKVKSESDDDFNQETSTSEIHIYPAAKSVILPKDREITVRGEFFSAHTGHHRRDVVMAVLEVIK
jgi:hypothetical protein